MSSSLAAVSEIGAIVSDSVGLSFPSLSLQSPQVASPLDPDRDRQPQFLSGAPRLTVQAMGDPYVRLRPTS